MQTTTAYQKFEDKKGPALAAQRFRMVQDIARELSGDVTFPICFDVVTRLREVLNDPRQSIPQIGKVIQGDPLVCSKLLNLANSAAYNRSGTEIRDLRVAIQRLGLNMVRSTALAVAMKQMLLSKGMVEFQGLTKRLWNHSIHTASAACVIARRLSRVNPEDAFLAGLVHDLGAFYMLYRSVQYDELRERPDTVRYLAMQWHESIGEMLLNALGLPERIVLAIHEHDQPRPAAPAPATLADVVHIANALAGGASEWFFQDRSDGDGSGNSLAEAYLALQPEIQALAEETLSAFS